ncbi:MAG: site-specific integrase [Firmicutes bacterium]|nr:site-specific integrase [Bacillota bacterium]
MASVKRVTHKNGRVVYRIVISMGYDRQGGKMVRNLTYSVDQSATPRQQEKEALRYALEMEDKIKYGHDLRDENISFEDFSRKWLESVRNTLSFGTYVGYEQLLRSRILPYFKSYKLTHVKTAHIEAFYRTLADAYSAGTIRRYANVMNCIFGTARRWDVIENNPCQGARKPQKKKDAGELKYFTPGQSLMFLRSLELDYPDDHVNANTAAAPEGSGRRVEGHTAGVYRVATQFKVFYTLSLFCGFRKGETLALHWNDIDFERQEISVTKSIGKTAAGFDYKEPKNNASVRTIPFPDRVFSLLKEYRKEYDTARELLGDRWQGDGNLFVRADGRLMGQSTAYQHFTRHLKRYNRWVREHPEEARTKSMEELPAIPLHGLRHSCATLLHFLEVNIVDISKYLGHASCSTTMNIYAHSFEAQKKAAQEKLNAFLQGSTG